ncbi:glycosyltransferase family 9 protein [Candidatus Dactylopiibacterium carminicum]|uniref:glycosyltransferase family 9 protein n=1 Tax=Candidatus Dactylopiibacterium carminicum TaxID=857335 RepID=UPI001482C71A|nr:glycosyltransferase family 9 protein [Candidatus Dactylopiibacterium carminicum]
MILKRDKLGDMLLTTPMLRWLRQQLPDARIDVLANTYNAWVLDGNPDVDRVLTYQRATEGGRIHWKAVVAQLQQVFSLRREHYDWVIAANGEYSHRALKRARWVGGRNLVSYHEGAAPSWLSHPLTVPAGLHETQRLTHLLSALTVPLPESPLPLRFSLPEESRRFARAWLDERGLAPGGYITLGLGARRAKRQPTADQVKRWTRYFHEQWGLQTVFMWTPGKSDNPLYPGDDDIAQPVLDAGMPWLHPFRGPLKPALGLIWHGRTSLFPDSGLMHFAAASPGGVLGFFAEVEASPPPSQWAPVGPRARWLEAPKTLSDLDDGTVFAALTSLVEPHTDEIPPLCTSGA